MKSISRSFARSAFAGLLGLSLSLVGVTSSTAGMINFDALDTSAGDVTGSAINTYLAGFGVTVANETLNPDPTKLDPFLNVRTPPTGDTNVVLVSNPNYLAQWWSGVNGTSFDLIFNQPLVDLRVSIPQITPGVSVPGWSITAIDAAGSPLTTSFGQSGISGSSARRTFLFDSATNTGLQGIRVFSNVFGRAGMGGIPIDDIEFTQIAPVPEPSTLVLFGLGMVSLGGYHWRGKRRVA